ncbi:similar to Saccharomyces cerevisiae YDR181C SAS4 Subunit of the SAS complex (Sas2p, Sas4p, Sas5p), which acetylates free histones and nucleosomes and regulates transcriptional silencing [Maudiozyma saulgeensis]|uniref:Similar to Saccharomyces cerevisiae YDR181C SAS4 Subunit of the SAS complex (Sas2p, Sas4p, Sas5p), which acetylates free histones and nucleosomes and regulates transcriptional silencing n=1 Tax=Maudiozyma saulgeensis TaxID=1789683 RepID=A0A1X7R2D7_9SACH|nr:similar to Saccharomyces cerevisiae YDR181C SAS4 Subunit of the SAS complex (Sas2p, Sas4p, Sas5p), which acetylates free histones and nucleosomes and regulates transcriptional silencing [Kazachstania saulgeensis]
MNIETETKARSTRSSASIDNQIPPTFEFDFSHEIDPDRGLQCLSRGLQRNSSSPNDTSIQNTRTSISKMVLKIEDNVITKKNDADKIVTVDSLPDTLYYAFHKKMLRQENRMIESDINESYETAEHLEQLYNKLEIVTWPTALAKMTKINDPTDMGELNEKRQMTMDKIMNMLDKYNLMNEHASILQKHKSKFKINPLIDYSKIYRTVDHLLLDNYESSSDEDEEELTTEQIRAHRLKKRTKTCGGVITIGLKTRELREQFAIIAQPLKTPYVIKLTTKERDQLSANQPLRRVFKYSRTLKNSLAKLKHREAIPVTMTVNEKKRKSLINQYNIENGIEDIVTEIDPPLHHIIHTPSTSETNSRINETFNTVRTSTTQQVQYIQLEDQIKPGPIFSSQQQPQAVRVSQQVLPVLKNPSKVKPQPETSHNQLQIKVHNQQVLTGNKPGLSKLQEQLKTQFYSSKTNGIDDKQILNQQHINSFQHQPYLHVCNGSSILNKSHSTNITPSIRGIPGKQQPNILIPHKKVKIQKP